MKTIFLTIILILSTAWFNSTSFKPFIFPQREVKFTIENFYSLLRQKVKHPEIVMRQAILETGWFKSKNFKENNNAFGMMQAYNRKTTALKGKRKGYAVYATWQDTIEDYRLWQEHYEKKGYNINNYYSFLEKVGYAEDTSYVKILKSIKFSLRVSV